jgi:hypothetical protein
MEKAKILLVLITYLSSFDRLLTKKFSFKKLSFTKAANERLLSGLYL